LEWKVAEKVWISKPIDLDNLRVSGYPPFVHVSSENQFKLDPKSKKYVSVGYIKGVKRVQVM